MTDRESLPRLRAAAQLLLKKLRGGDRATAERLARLQSFAADGAAALLQQPARVRLKHALTLVAVERGFASWPALKRAREATGDEVYAPRVSLYLNLWFAEHAEARQVLAAQGGYLLPYRRYCYITSAEGVRELGLDPDDPDWARIGFDWLQPADREAHARLQARWRELQAAGGR